MALSTATITFDLADWVGTDFDARRTRGYLSTNAPEGYVTDTSANKIRVDDASVTVGTDGTGSVTVWVPGAGANPATWQTTFHFDVPLGGGRGRRKLTMGPFTITTSDDLADLIEEQIAIPTATASDYATAAGASATAAASSATSAATSATAAAASEAAAETARDEAVDISNIDTSDGVVSTLVAGTAGAGPLTRSALSASTVRTVGLSNGSNDATALAAAIVAASATPGGIVRGTPGQTYRLPSTLTISTEVGITVDFSGCKLIYTGSGDAFKIENGKLVILDVGNLDLSTAGASAVGIHVAGLWFGDIRGRITQKTSSTQTDLLIETSKTGGDNWGAYHIDVHNLDATNPKGLGAHAGTYHIRTKQTPGDSVYVTHLRVHGGWAKNRDYGLYLSHLHSGHIEGFCGDEGLKSGIYLDYSSDVYLAPGELNDYTEYGIQYGSHMEGPVYRVFASEISEGGALGYEDTTYYSPILDSPAEVKRFGSRTVQDYWFSAKSFYSFAKSFVVKVQGGGSIRELFAWGSSAGLTIDPGSGGTKTVGPLGTLGTTGAANPGRFCGVTATGAPTTGTFAVGDFVLTQNGQMLVCVTAGTPGTWVNPSPISGMSLLTTGQETIPRICSSTSFGMTSQLLYLTYFTARKSETINTVRVVTGGTAAGATPTLVRFGLYSIDASGNGTLVASTANDTTLMATTFAANSKGLSSGYAVVAGQRYAFAALVVSGATMPTISGLSNLTGTEMAQAPQVGGQISAQTDLPASFTAGTVSASSRAVYAALVP